LLRKLKAFNRAQLNEPLRGTHHAPGGGGDQAISTTKYSSFDVSISFQ
jgi:hypothetical protein